MTPRSSWDWQSAYPAPAKLNLFLHVTGRRADGYHLLQTLFRFVDHGDTLRFARRDDGQLRLTQPLPGVPPESDLCIRAARLLQDATGCRLGADIEVVKRLPMGGGLGGGSSDAATVLLALNHLWGLGLPRQRLQALGLTLGADVPLFIFGKNAFGEGIGEALQPVELPPSWFVVLEPPVQVPTAAIFTSPELCRDTPAIRAADWRPGFGHNDLEAVAVARFPEVGESLRWLAGFAPARMTGSGACVFAEFTDAAQARAVLADLPASMRGWAAPGLAEHPLCALAD
ncbi:4-(cytidine 5'-diphospho)-2-C-methyl-D-erythritol kinase [Propionivibrio dicarboxylicus]|uniref:4-diphosphocytidyl-2-C-methyl-D-erythritol kinase n=1 Tax=Propionivibrio dicarboxylicus TaxID=83767 RepID=A0A1G7V4K2_9RHOO|nr:4-(cytidine 5'-diphospho)-2-C-methyl-D-erythritol kinase [Propionivibrio dicarboxylicus]SDG54647.1 4-diphosphocytidyl-2-C-methyl-D-erythritol kinase [Propionivibrio dicarboxylicus]